MGKQRKQYQTLFFGAPKITADGDYSHEIKRPLLFGRKVNDQPRQHIQKQRHYFASKDASSQSCVLDLSMGVVLGRKLMTNLESILKSRDITLPAKVCLVKAMIFQIVRYECKRWTIKKAKH